MWQTPPLRIGTRSSPLALAQAEEVRERLLAAHPALHAEDIVLIPMKTSGDQLLQQNLAEIGGKGLFTKEIEEALLANKVDIAVHSMKDMPAHFPKGLVIDCLLPRENPQDAFLSAHYASIDALPHEAVVGTSSTRRAAQLLRLRPDVKIIPFRGNVNTRLAKLERGEVAATFLAVAGLKRLELAQHIRMFLPTETMLPAVAQGAIGVERRADDTKVAALLEPLNHPETACCVRAERQFLTALEGSCKTSLAALAELQGEILRLRTRLLSPDGQHCTEMMVQGTAAEAEALGQQAAEKTLQQSPFYHS